MRGPADDPSASHDERQRRCLHAVSDLHVDTMDGSIGGSLGTMALYVLHASGGGGGVDDRTLGSRDIAVFPPGRGGRGVRVRVLCPGWICALMFDTSKSVHGGVTLDSSDDGAQHTLYLPSQLAALRVITYPLSRIQTLLQNLVGDLTAGKVLEEESDARLRDRMHKGRQNPRMNGAAVVE